MIVICIKLQQCNHRDALSGLGRELCTGSVAMRHTGTTRCLRAAKYGDWQNVSRATGTVRTAYSDANSKTSEGNQTFVCSNIQLGRGHAFVFNLLKPAGHYMHHQFNIQQLYALPTPYLCVLYLSENKQRLVPLTA